LHFADVTVWPAQAYYELVPPARVNLQQFSIEMNWYQQWATFFWHLALAGDGQCDVGGL